MMDDIYNSRILEFAGNIPRSGRLEPADAEASAHSKLCGSKVKVTIRMIDGHITDFAHDVKACALGQASSSIMARNIVGASVEEVRAARDAMLAMLKADGEGPDGRFSDMRILRPVKDYKARHASTMLTFDAVVDAIGQVEAARSAASAMDKATA
ncbi:iron-sulfur cluster assembly scaffold protein [Rhizobium sp. NFR03]|uniref:iron-sulfur cluster assembly scaffold protein n=1 Tax=Rhizobium sp. NFR03 TaxID=1566263 RepID=UPI000B84F593|nr:iron-sulfur cluster assembly scaffold protein [Rhizobium sp. NFR03]